MAAIPTLSCLPNGPYLYSEGNKPFCDGSHWDVEFQDPGADRV